MNWSAADIVAITCHLLALTALTALWVEDRQRIYIFWWSFALACEPLSTISARWMPTTITSAADLIAPLIQFLLASIQTVGLIGGVLAYRSRTPRIAVAALAVLAVLLLILAPTAFGLYPVSRIFAGSAIGVSSLVTAWLLWPIGGAERVAAATFGVRASVVAFVVLVSGTGHRGSPIFQRTFLHISSIAAILAMTAALSLLIAAYRRTMTQLRIRNSYLELSRELTAELQGVSDENSVGTRVLETMIRNHRWEQGGLFFVAADGVTMQMVSRAGLPVSREIKQISRLDDEVTKIALKTRRVCFSDDLPNDMRVHQEMRDRAAEAGMRSQIWIPVVDRDDVLGFVLLRSRQKRSLGSTEAETLESLGRVIGMSLANARNLSALAFRANHDSLTGLGNRLALHECFTSEYRSRPCAVLLFDLDRFKHINDVLGHSVGDEMLREIARRLQQHFSGSAAHSFRLGGDEFVVLHALDASGNNAQSIAQSLAQLIAQPMTISEMRLRTSASIGIAITPTHGDDSHELLRCADIAMYRAKHSGSGIALYQQDIDPHEREHLTLLTSITDALAQDQFVLYYQPVIEMASGKATACEALVRWQDPLRGVIDAGAFMPLLEATDLIRDFTYRMFELALKDATRWKKRGQLVPLRINLSARNILDPELPRYLIDTARLHQIAPASIQLELTETLLIRDPGSAEDAMNQLVEAGFSFSLDDFGTGYSSLAYLARFPISALKIDRRFVHDMLTQRQSRTIVESSIALAHGLGMEVIAEGVEHQGEAALLRELGCDAVQGFLYTRALPPDDFSDYWALHSQ